MPRTPHRTTHLRRGLSELGRLVGETLMFDEDCPPGERIPSVDSDGLKWYFDAADGTRWVIGDYISASEWTKPVLPGSPRANRRVFVRTDGTRRVYDFRRHEPRVLAPTFVERQLRESQLAHPRVDDEGE